MPHTLPRPFLQYQSTLPAFYAVISRVVLTDARFFISYVQQLNLMPEYQVGGALIEVVCMFVYCLRKKGTALPWEPMVLMQGVELFGLILDHWADKVGRVVREMQKG